MLTKGKKPYWHKADLERNRKHTRQRVELVRRSQGDGVTAEQWLAIRERQGNRCIYCGCSGTLSQDHVVPLKRKGQHDCTNIVAACLQCNASKKASLILEWIVRLGGVPERTACAG